MYRLITLDLDGTLVDTAGEIAEAANLALEDFGLPRRQVADITLLIGKGTRELMTRLREQIVASHPSLASRLNLGDLLDRFDVRYAETTGTAARLYPGCREGLDALRAAGIQLACVTNKEQRFARRVLEVTDLAHYFPVVLGGDTLAQKKPDPLVIEYCMQELGGDRRSTAHVGDSHIDVDTARNAGVAAWGVPYGYNAGVPIAQHQPDRVFDSLAEMARHVLALRAAPEHAR